jgi:hypothetical protein
MLHLYSLSEQRASVNGNGEKKPLVEARPLFSLSPYIHHIYSGGF